MTRLHVQVTLIAATPARLQHGAWHARIMHYPCDKLILSSSQVTRYEYGSAQTRSTSVSTLSAPHFDQFRYGCRGNQLSLRYVVQFVSQIRVVLANMAGWHTGRVSIPRSSDCGFKSRQNPNFVHTKNLAHSLLLPPLTWLHPSTLHRPISQNLLHSLPIQLCLINTSLD